MSYGVGEDGEAALCPAASNAQQPISIVYVPSHLYHMLFELFKVRMGLGGGWEGAMGVWGGGRGGCRGVWELCRGCLGDVWEGVSNRCLMGVWGGLVGLGGP